MHGLITPAGVAALAAGALLATAAAQAAGTAQVRWLQPERYADAGRSEVDRARTQEILAEHLRRLCARLPDDQVLQVEVLDLDLAGSVEPWHLRDLRVLRGRADWPRMSLRYTLSSPARTIKSGQAELSDMHYAFSTRPGELGHEKHMLEAWFKDAIATP